LVRDPSGLTRIGPSNSGIASLKLRDHRRLAMTKDVDNSGIPEEIKRHAPRPLLRPGGSLKAMADEVDRMVRAEQAAANEARKRESEAPEPVKKKHEWGTRLNASRRRGIGYRISRDGG
jgi:hypothetical protein